MFGIDDAVNSVGSLFKTVLDKVAPDANAKIALQQAHDAEVSAAGQQAAQIEGAKYQSDIDLLKKQLDVNLADASNANIFISGARPFAMWSMTITVQLLAVVILVAIWLGHAVGAFNEIFYVLVSVLCTLLGVHTVERHRGVAPEQPDGPNVPAPFSVSKAVESTALESLKTEAGKLFLKA